MEHIRQIYPATASKRLITKKMVAQRLCISTRTVDRMVKASLLQKIFLHGSVRFREQDIEEIVEKGI